MAGQDDLINQLLQRRDTAAAAGGQAPSSQRMNTPNFSNPINDVGPQEPTAGDILDGQQQQPDPGMIMQIMQMLGLGQGGPQGPGGPQQ